MPRPAHFEIHASDPQKLQDFYSQLFGWTFQAWGPPGMYWLIMTESGDEPGINGGLVPRRGSASASGQPVNAYVCTTMVPSAKDFAAKALSLGAEEALPIMPVPGVGWLVYMKDPDGNLFGMMQNDSAAA